MTIVTTPGHTPGTLSMIFTVKDNGKPMTVAYSGGTAFNFPSTAPNFDIYIKSQSKMAAAAAAANATVLMSNHSEFDNAVTKIKMLALRKPGEPHPFDDRERRGGAVFHGHRGMCAGGAAQVSPVELMEVATPPKAVVLFDGVCNLCNGTVQFIVAHDPAAHFHFAALESETAGRLLGETQMTARFRIA